MSIPKTCSVAECSGKRHRKGLCAAHFRRVQLGRPDPYGVLNRHERHNGWGSPLYTVWTDMRYRVSNSKIKHFDRYGGRGIKVCERWEKSFAAFRDDVGDGYGPGLTLDRIENDGDYEPGNVRWVTQQVQNMNKAHLTSRNSSGFRGVNRSANGQRWVARIAAFRKSYRLGTFDTKEQAAIAYNKAAKKYHGKLANLNVV